MNEVVDSDAGLIVVCRDTEHHLEWFNFISDVDFFLLRGTNCGLIGIIGVNEIHVRLGDLFMENYLTVAELMRKYLIILVDKHQKTEPRITAKASQRFEGIIIV